MQWLDIVILSIIGISALISLMRGFIKEALSLLGWLAAIWVSIQYSDKMADLLASSISTPSIRFVIAFTALFVATLLISTLLNNLIAKIVKKTGLSGTDRMIGVIFGMARGATVVAVLVLLAGLTTLPQDPFWQQSMLVGHFQQMASWADDYMPPEVASGFTYN